MYVYVSLVVSQTKEPCQSWQHTSPDRFATLARSACLLPLFSPSLSFSLSSHSQSIYLSICLSHSPTLILECIHWKWLVWPGSHRHSATFMHVFPLLIAASSSLTSNLLTEMNVSATGSRQPSLSFERIYPWEYGAMIERIMVPTNQPMIQCPFANGLSVAVAVVQLMYHHCRNGFVQIRWTFARSICHWFTPLHSVVHCHRSVLIA